MAEEKSASSGIIKFSPVVTLNALNGVAELGFDIGKEL
jgi:hypothetical protein